MRKYFLLTILIGLGCFAVLTALNSHAADVKADYQPMVDAFFQKIQEGKTREAVSDLFADNPWVVRSPDIVDQLTSGLDGIQKVVGKYYDNQLLDEKAMTRRFVNVSYLVFYDRQPVMVGFQFYMPQDTWRAYALFYEPGVDKELHESRTMEKMLRDHPEVVR